MHTAPRVERKQVFVGGDQDRRTRGQCQFEVLVVAWVTAVADRHKRIEPQRRSGQCPDNVVPIGLRDNADELRTCEDLADFVQDRPRQGNSGGSPGAIERLARVSGRAQRRANNRARIKNDQPCRAARSAFHAARS